MDLHTSIPASSTPAVLSLDELREILLPEPGERVLFVPQCSYHLVALADHNGLVGLPACAIEPLLTPAYGAPYWHTYQGRDIVRGRDHEIPIGYAVLLVRDGVIRRGPQNWDSGD